ncbi:MAG: metallophosphoesterase [Prevotellaceae bacterium]|jgi:hypothetical protein|nr:metallophosphoesterase [Prevotellaceae bacterium]
MKPTIIIGDIHGLTYWKEVIKQNPDCRYIFMGDYLDPYTHVSYPELIGNLNDVIAFKEAHPDEVILLLGNHDMHYITEKMPPCSRYNYSIEKEVGDIFFSNRALFQYAFQDGRYLFTHAGVTQPWFDDDFKGDIMRNIADQLNHPANEEQDLALYFCSHHRGGPNDNSGIFWTDIAEMERSPLKGFTQVVGHNRVRDILTRTANDGIVIFCDCLFNKKYLKL